MPIDDNDRIGPKNVEAFCIEIGEEYSQRAIPVVRKIIADNEDELTKQAITTQLEKLIHEQAKKMGSKVIDTVLDPKRGFGGRS